MPMRRCLRDCAPFIFAGAQVAQGRVSAAGVVEALDVLEIAVLADALVCQRSRWINSFLIVATNDSAIALSYASPPLPIEAGCPPPDLRAELHRCVLRPPIGVMDKTPPGFRRDTAIESASTTNSARICPAIDQPTPCGVRIEHERPIQPALPCRQYVRSATHNLSAESDMKRRPTQLG
jgi:hypothetical protein